MWKIIQRVFIGIVVSCFFYPFEFTFLPGINTKMMLAVVGVLAFVWNFKTKEQNRVSIDIVFSACLAFVFSLLCYMSEVLCGTEDGSYTTYFSSFFVWLFGAYAVCSLIRWGHGKADLKTITYYLAAVGVFQCIMAQLIDSYPAVQQFVDSIIEQGQWFVKKVNRIYGIGASLDSGGVRLAITLLLICYFIIDNGKEDGHAGELWFLYLSYIVITIFGNMIARTTTVGAIAGIAYLLLQITVNARVNLQMSRIRSFFIIFFIILVSVPIFIYLYTTNSDMHSQMRFAFEGFFNWVETGNFRTSSTDKLQDVMWIWPETPRGWWIGTGIFGNWTYGTDIGYCRLILYCGIVGFSAFSLFFIHNAFSVARKFDNCKLLALMLGALTFVIWLKVSTDIFQIYALLFCADAMVRADKLDSATIESI